MHLKHVSKISLLLLASVCSPGLIIGCKSNSDSSLGDVAKPQTPPTVKSEQTPVVKAETPPAGLAMHIPQLTGFPPSRVGTKDLSNNKNAIEAVKPAQNSSTSSLHPAAGHEVNDAK